MTKEATDRREYFREYSRRPEVRARRLEYFREYHAKADARDRHTEYMRRRRSDPAYRAESNAYAAAYQRRNVVRLGEQKVNLATMPTELRRIAELIRETRLEIRRRREST